jgi:hypothetical protein
MGNSSASRNAEKLVNSVIIGAILTDIISHAGEFLAFAWCLEMALDKRCTECGYRLEHPIVNHTEHHEALRAQSRTGHAIGVRARRINGVRNLQHKRESVPMA